MLDDVDVGVERLDRHAAPTAVFGIADPLGVVDHLALQVGLVDDVVVDEAERADPGRGEVEGGRRAEAAGADQQHLRVQQLQLALDPDLGQQGVARVAVRCSGVMPSAATTGSPCSCQARMPPAIEATFS